MTPPAELTISLPRLHKGQRRIVEDSGRFNVLMCGRRFGKTTFGTERVIRAVLDGLPVGWFAPNYSYLTDPWYVLNQRLRPIIAKSSKQEKQIRLTNGSSVDFWTLDNPDAGRSRKYGLAVLDECGMVKQLDQIFNAAIRPTLTDLKGSVYMLGTPKGRGAFFRYFRQGQSGDRGWRSFSGETVDNPYIDPAEVEEARLMLPQHVFDQEYRGIPADDAGNPFGIDAIEACVGEMSEAEPVAFGIDLARSQDWTVVVGVDADCRVCRFDRFQLPWNEQVGRIKSMVGEHRCMVDATGVGDAVITMMHNEGVYADPFVFTAPSKQDLMRSLQIAIQRQELNYPEGEIAEELRMFEYQISGANVRYSAPSGLHDDCVMALALAMRMRASSSVPEVRVWS